MTNSSILLSHSKSKPLPNKSTSPCFSPSTTPRATTEYSFMSELTSGASPRSSSPRRLSPRTSLTARQSDFQNRQKRAFAFLNSQGIDNVKLPMSEHYLSMIERHLKNEQDVQKHDRDAEKHKTEQDRVKRRYEHKKSLSDRETVGLPAVFSRLTPSRSVEPSSQVGNHNSIETRRFSLPLVNSSRRQNVIERGRNKNEFNGARNEKLYKEALRYC